VLREHKKDAPYLALALAYNCKILSGDKKLKKKVPELVLTTKDALDILVGKRME